MTLDLQTRQGWPADLRIVLDRYPREVWTAHTKLGQVAQFWLERHSGFRHLGGALNTATDEFREGTLAPAEFRRSFAPRLQCFLESQEGHYKVEDFHYFPVFFAQGPMADDEFAEEQ